MPDLTDNHDLHTYEQGDTPWTHSDDMDHIEEHLAIRDSEENLNDYTPHNGARFIATDTGAVYDGDGTNWNLSTRNYDEVGLNGEYRSSWDGPSDLTVDVPSDEDTVHDAVISLLETSTSRGATATVNIESGHLWQETVDIEDGQDASWITIESEDATVNVPGGFSSWLLNIERGSQGPRLMTLIDGEGNTGVERLYRVRRGSTGWVGPGAGFENFPNGYAFDARGTCLFHADDSIARNVARASNIGDGSIGSINDCDFTNCTGRAIRATVSYLAANGVNTSGSQRALHLDNVSIADVSSCNFNNTDDGVSVAQCSTARIRNTTMNDSGNNGLNVGGTSTALVYESEVNDADGRGVSVSTGSNVGIYDTEVLRANEEGLRVNGSYVNARQGEVKDSGNEDIRVEWGTVLGNFRFETTNSTDIHMHENDLNIAPNTVTPDGIIMGEYESSD